MQCALCGYPARSLARHLRREHKIEPDVYADKHGPYITDAAKSKYSAAAKAGDNWDWIRRAKARGDDLSEYKAKMGKAVSAAIMADPNERARRSRLMSVLNADPEFRLVTDRASSIAAKRTSQRSDIIAQRTAQLQRWRDKNPDKFYEKCTKVMIDKWTSKPEHALFITLSSIFPFLKKYQRVYSKRFESVKSKRRALDIANKQHLIAIEFDGKIHFEQLFEGQDLNKIRTKDHELNTTLPQLGWILIRVSYDQYSYKAGEGFNDECIRRVVQLIEQGKPGCYKIGDAYADPPPMD